MNDANTTLLRHGDRQSGFGDGIHRCGDQRYGQRNVSRQASLQGGVFGQDSRIGRHEQHIIEGECFLEETHGNSRRRKTELYRNHPAISDAGRVKIPGEMADLRWFYDRVGPDWALKGLTFYWNGSCAERGDDAIPWDLLVKDDRSRCDHHPVPRYPRV